MCNIYIRAYNTLTHTHTPHAFLAQSVERGTLNLVVMGSIPIDGFGAYSNYIRYC